MYRECKSHADQSRCVSELADAAFALKRSLGYSDPDARTVALDNIGAIARAGQMTLNLLDSWAKGDNEVRRIIPQLIGLTTVTEEGVRSAGDMLNKSARLALVVLAQFQVENAFRNAARELSISPLPKGLYRAANAVLAALGIPSDRMEILNTPARIRNSLHTNGIHHRQHPSELPLVNIKGVTYEFQDGARVMCASWEHIGHALEVSVGVLGEVFQHPRIRAIADPMMDQYAWDIETRP